MKRSYLRACRNPNLDAQFIPFSQKVTEGDKVQTIKGENKSFPVDDTRRERIFTVQEHCVSAVYTRARERYFFSSYKIYHTAYTRFYGSILFLRFPFLEFTLSREISGSTVPRTNTVDTCAQV